MTHVGNEALDNAAIARMGFVLSSPIKDFEAPDAASFSVAGKTAVALTSMFFVTCRDGTVHALRGELAWGDWRMPQEVEEEAPSQVLEQALPVIRDEARQAGLFEEGGDLWLQGWFAEAARNEAAHVAARLEQEVQTEARRKPVDRRTAFDNFVLATSENVPADLQAPLRSGEDDTPAVYWQNLLARLEQVYLVADKEHELVDPRELPDDMDVAQVQKLTALLIAHGLTHCSRPRRVCRPTRRGPERL